MNWTKEDAANLRAFRNNIDYDGIRVKECIKKALLNNKYIIHTLNDKELEAQDAEPDEYFGSQSRIRPYYMIPETETSTGNYLCYTVSFTHMPDNNKLMKYLQVQFVILCEQKNIIDEETSLARHDLLAALIQDQFNYTNIFGSKIQLVADKEDVVDTAYSSRLLTFQSITDNNLVKSTNRFKMPILANKEVVTLDSQIPAD